MINLLIFAFIGTIWLALFIIILIDRISTHYGTYKIGKDQCLTNTQYHYPYLTIA